MRKIFKEPLVQFIIGGMLLYGAVATFARTPPVADRMVIPVNTEALLLYLQYQDKVFDGAEARKNLAELDVAALARLEADYINHEVLVREALALGLDQNDEVIRRRLIQKMDFIVQGAAGPAPVLKEIDLESYFDTHSDAYALEAEATFTHVFFKAKTRGQAGATEAAQRLLPILNKGGISFEQAGQYGDRFYFLRNYIQRSQRMIADHFGTELTDQLFQLQPGGMWAGPYHSQYGSHLILLRSKTASRIPALQEVKAQVLADMRRQQRETARATAIAQLAEKYTLKRSVNTP